MSRKERVRLEVMGRVKRDEITLVKAAELLHMSYGQAKRLYGRYRIAGDRALVHACVVGSRIDARTTCEVRRWRCTSSVTRILVQRWQSSICAVKKVCRSASRHCDSGCWRPACGSGGGASRIACVGPARNTSARCRRWTVPITTGSKGDATGPC